MKQLKLFIFTALLFIWCSQGESNIPNKKLINDLFINFSKSLNSKEINEYFLKFNLSLKQCLTDNYQPNNNLTFNHLIQSITNKIILPQCFNESKNQISNKSTWKNHKMSYKMWIFGILSVTFINGCAALGVLFIPLMKRSFYKTVMNFMIALAVGSLAGSALLILIPDAFGMTELEHIAGVKYSYKWRATAVLGGVYMFFLLERLLKYTLQRNSMKSKLKETDMQGGSMNLQRKLSHRLSGSSLMIDDAPENGDAAKEHCLKMDESNIEICMPNKKYKVAPVAWMIIFGDALHNFVDGLSIGAAFSKDIFTGISLSLAVLCEELPHELGDFAILITAGMSVRRALYWNMLSACTCYIGFFVGITLGELTSGSVWIFAIAGGMFLYISLVDMMPEINAVLEDRTEEEIKNMPTSIVFLIQNLGLLSGYGVILLMALYGSQISIN